MLRFNRKNIRISLDKLSLDLGISFCFLLLVSSFQKQFPSPLPDDGFSPLRAYIFRHRKLFIQYVDKYKNKHKDPITGISFIIIAGLTPLYHIGYRETVSQSEKLWENEKSKPTGLWNVEEIETIYDCPKMILTIAQDAPHNQSFVTIEAGKMNGLWN